MMMKMLCCGFFPALQRTLEYKTLRLGEVNRARQVCVSASGKATNSARVASQLGADVQLISFAGGANGEQLRELLAKEAFEFKAIATRAETRICQTLLADDPSECTELVEENPPPSAADWNALIRQFELCAQRAEQIVLSGNLPPHAPQEIYAELLARAEGKAVLIDSSQEPLLAALPQIPSLVKLNAKELANTVRHCDDPIEQARELIARGAGAVGITRGAEPAHLVTPSSVVRFSIPTIEAVNPTGSGDAVNAGVCFALAKGSALPEAFAFGLACGTSNAMSSQPGVISARQIAALIPTIELL